MIPFNDLLSEWGSPIEVEHSFEDFAELLKKNKVSKYDRAHYLRMSVNDRRRAKRTDQFILGLKINGKWYRNGITMDVDFFGNEFLEHLTSFNKYTYILHSSFSCSSHEKHFHLLIPLADIVDVYTYRQIYDDISKIIGPKYFESCGRYIDLPMYMPETLKGEDYIFIYNKGMIYNAK